MYIFSSDQQYQDSKITRHFVSHVNIQESVWVNVMYRPEGGTAKYDLINSTRRMPDAEVDE